jgi:hypothetical protein
MKMLIKTPQKGNDNNNKKEKKEKSTKLVPEHKRKPHEDNDMGHYKYGVPPEDIDRNNTRVDEK